MAWYDPQPPEPTAAHPTDFNRRTEEPAPGQKSYAHLQLQLNLILKTWILRIVSILVVAPFLLPSELPLPFSVGCRARRGFFRSIDESVFVQQTPCCPELCCARRNCQRSLEWLRRQHRGWRYQHPGYGREGWQILRMTEKGVRQGNPNSEIGPRQRQTNQQAHSHQSRPRLDLSLRLQERLHRRAEMRSLQTVAPSQLPLSTSPTLRKGFPQLSNMNRKVRRIDLL